MAIQMTIEKNGIGGIKNAKNTKEMYEYTKTHADNQVVKENIETYADGQYAIIFSGQDLSKLAEEYKVDAQDLLRSADRQNNGNEGKTLPLQAGDVIILNKNKTRTLAQQEQIERLEAEIQAKEAVLENKEKWNNNFGIGTIAGGAVLGIGALAKCGLKVFGAVGGKLAKIPVYGWMIAAAVTAIGAVAVNRRLVNCHNLEQEIKDLKDQLNTLKGQ